MEYIKSMIVVLAAGMIAGAVIGACNSDFVCDTIKQGKREIRRFKRKYM